MEQGFPRGYGISLLSHQQTSYPCTLQAGETLSFSLLLYGHFCTYYQAFTEALQEMCRMGLGHPLQPFRLVSISEKSAEEKLYPLCQDSIDTVHPLQHPVTLESFTRHYLSPEQKEIKIRYEVPVNFFKSIGKGENTYKDKGHEFPGFYQLVHAAAYRVATLAALYASPDDLSLYQKFDELADDFLKYARTPLLTTAELKRVDQYVIKRPNAPHPIRLTGYVGEVGFSGYFNYYIPLLFFARNLGVGSHATYGMGRYQIMK